MSKIDFNRRQYIPQYTLENMNRMKISSQSINLIIEIPIHLHLHLKLFVTPICSAKAPLNKYGSLLYLQSSCFIPPHLCKICADTCIVCCAYTTFPIKVCYVQLLFRICLNGAHSDSSSPLNGWSIYCCKVSPHINLLL